MGLLEKTREKIRSYFEKRMIRNNFKRELKGYSWNAYLFATNIEWVYGWYRKLTKTHIWKQAKKTLKKYYLFKYGDLRCGYCYKRIELNSTFVLHHRRYVWHNG